MKFADLGLSDELLKSVLDAGYDEPTPIQAQAIPAVLMMKDIIGIAQTGTGKTAGFVLPMIDILAHGRRRALMPRSLILEPTRELAAQVAENFEKYGKNHDLKMALLIGGVQMGDQVKALQEGVDVLIATPGRLMDLFERGKILLTGCEMLVIDEADRMLDMGFIPDIENICSKLPTTRQTLLFSATMPPPIKKLADKFLSNPKSIEVARPAATNTNIAQFKVRSTTRQKREVLRHLLRTDNVSTAIIFANRKTTVRELAKSLQRHGFAAGEIHGDMDQSARNAELQKFKDGEISILCASDVAARGLDVKGVSHVFNFDTPWHPDDYVHRVGRTGRGGATGRAFTLVSDEDSESIENVEKLQGTKIPEFKVELPGKEERKPRESGAERDEEPKRGSRRERPAREERKPRAERESRPEREARPEREVRAERAPRREPTPYRDQSEPPSKPGEWNGPIPEFLAVSAL
ncbi:DEAD/DEAH box helicase-like protein [Novosphingobium aromaticivorans DSM 12444]|uniref:DEAD-box ATP-dependent RNA helicase RhpA n=1 Tax=Novosphingobium aromaticivorans (strain ATCC 700278 / DSM 12444 / CCUG 56034 / CIP 105152 / NBRC 16084 / F199) TaxID=279238 RepID=Q2G8T7_NOVAD|nr:DEAD/DEAH box helicase [Novosphingobium aromaticivorans]ABD25736.1 DEAD/DEAH box helicase-like protein [Novosphingobium aromaticivorans DSM 12444]SCY02109.1 Superfamily II DNA and RNA helicase [Novosphingobium aromaticivorans]